MYRLTLAFAKELEWATLPNIHKCTYYKAFNKEEYHMRWPGHRCTFHAVLTPSERGALLAIECLRDNRTVNREIMVLPQQLVDLRGFEFRETASA